MARKKKRAAVASPTVKLKVQPNEVQPNEPDASARRRRLSAGVAALIALAGGAGFWLFAKREARSNLLLVTIDTLRADRVGCYGYAGASTPAIDGLAGRGTRFDNAHSAAPITGPSHATILTGLFPPVHGVRDNVVFSLDARHVSLASLLKKQGYHTAAFVGAYPVASAFGFGQGFDRFDEAFHESPGLGQGAERPGNEVADATIAWLRQAPRGPFLAWMHLYDPHAPYAPPAPFDASFRARPYDGEVAFADAQVGRVLAALRESGREQETLVVLTADHGEGLGEHNEATHAILIYESTLRVPLILAGPGVPAGRVVTPTVGTVDIVPTVLGLLGIQAPSDLPGRDLRPSLKDHRLPPGPLYAESLFGRLNCRWSSLRAWTSDQWKLIDGSEAELYNLKDDPGEIRNRAAEDPERVRRMREAMRAAVARMAPEGDRARPVAISPEQAERLRSLGYTGGSGGSVVLDEPGLPDPRTRVPLFERLQVALIAQGPAIAAATEEAATIAAEDPGNPFAHFALASLAFRGGRLARADRAFARTLELDPDRPGMRHYYGRLLREMGRLEESERQLRIAVEQSQADDTSTRINLAQTLIALGKSEEAERIIEQAQRRDPQSIEVQGALGRLRVVQGRAEEAIPYLQKAAAGPEPEPSIELAAAYLALGRTQEAREATSRILERNPGHPWALIVAGQALLREGRREEGLQALRRALAIRPRRPDVWLSLARAFEAAGESEAAALCRREAKAIAHS